MAAIVEAATRVLAERGWAGFNTNAVAARAGVSIGSLYEYFANKQALADTILNDHLSRGEAAVAAAAADLAADPASQPGEIVAALVAGFVAVHRDDPRLHRVLSSEVPLTPETRARVERLRSEAIGFVGKRLTGSVAEPRLAAQLLVDTADAVIHRWFVEDDGRLAHPERLRSELEKMLTEYVAACGPQPDEDHGRD